MRQADRVTKRQNDSMTVWQNSRAAKEPALVLSNQARIHSRIARTSMVFNIKSPCSHTGLSNICTRSGLDRDTDSSYIG